MRAKSIQQLLLRPTLAAPFRRAAKRRQREERSHFGESQCEGRSRPKIRTALARRLGGLSTSHTPTRDVLSWLIHNSQSPIHNIHNDLAASSRIARPARSSYLRFSRCRLNSHRSGGGGRRCPGNAGPSAVRRIPTIQHSHHRAAANCYMDIIACPAPDGALDGSLESAPLSSLLPADADASWRAFWGQDDRYYACLTTADGAVRWFRIAEAAPGTARTPGGGIPAVPPLPNVAADWESQAKPKDRARMVLAVRAHSGGRRITSLAVRAGRSRRPRQ